MKYRVLEKRGTKESRYYIQFKFIAWWYVKIWDLGHKRKWETSNKETAINQAKWLQEKKKTVVIHI